MSSDDDSIPLDCARGIFDLSGRAIAAGYAQYGVAVIVAAMNEDGAAETTATQDRVRQCASPVGGNPAQGGSPGMTGWGPDRTRYSIAG